jgi:hypothetical protein
VIQSALLTGVPQDEWPAGSLQVRALGVPYLPVTHGQSRAQADGRSTLNQAIRRGGLPAPSWFPS